ncbi:hypothetical protein ACOSP7_023959 [Xanthoceras sorbifolium]
MNLEIESMYFNSVWKLVDLLDEIKPIGCKWIYKRKRGVYGKVVTFKARLVAKDVKTAFLNVNLDESIYMMQPEGFKSQDQEKKFASCKGPFMDLNKRLDLGTLGTLSEVKSWLANQFQMKDLGEASYVLGIQLIRDHKNKLLVLSQISNIGKILVRFSMQNSKKSILPSKHEVHLSKE